MVAKLSFSINTCMKKTSMQRFNNKSRKTLEEIPVPRDHPDYMKYYRNLRKDIVKKAHDKHADNNREKRRASVREWAKRNKEKVKAKNALERAERLKRLPSWADREAIAEFYKNCPEGYHVDHIIPLRGKYVSGLHVLENLQYLPAKENMSKGNRINLSEM